jgi:hypothetical protein
LYRKQLAYDHDLSYFKRKELTKGTRARQFQKSEQARASKSPHFLRYLLFKQGARPLARISKSSFSKTSNSKPFKNQLGRREFRGGLLS